MSKIVVSEDLAQCLAQVDGQAVLYDSAGRPLGVFLAGIASAMEPCVSNECSLPDEEPSFEETEKLRKRARDNPGKPLEEILSRLGF